MNDNLGLKIAGQRYSVMRSRENGPMMAVALRHAIYMSAMQRCGKQLRWSRYIELRHRTGPYRFAEVVSESWPGRDYVDTTAIAAEMFSRWERNPTDRGIIDTTHRFLGYGMSRSEHGIYYACIIVGD